MTPSQVEPIARALELLAADVADGWSLEKALTRTAEKLRDEARLDPTRVAAKKRMHDGLDELATSINAISNHDDDSAVLSQVRNRLLDLINLLNEVV